VEINEFNRNIERWECNSESNPAATATIDAKDKAIEFHRKASTTIAHNPPAAYAVPFAKKKLASLPS
jgi:hypothetical protein